MNKKSCETSEGATLEDVAPVLLLNDCFSLRQGQDVYALLSLVDLGYLTKSIIRSHYESKEDEGAWKWLDQSIELSKLTVPTLRSFSMELDGPCSSKDRKSYLVSYLSTFEGALRYLPAKAIGKARAFAESKRRAKLEELETRKRAKLVESVVGAEAMDGVVAMLLDERQKPRARIKYVDQENLLTALVEDPKRNCTKKTCKSVLLLTDGDIADMSCTEARNPIYSSRAPMRLYNLMKALRVSIKKHGDWSGLLKARESAERKSAERKRKWQETRNTTLESERTFFEDHTSFDEYFKEEEDWMVEEANYKGRYINYRAIERDAYDEARYRALKEWVECHYDTLDHEIQQDYFPPSLRVKAKELYNMTSKTSRERTVMKRDKRQARLAELQEEFGKRNLPVRDDSRLIKGYLARETPCPNELKFVADTMEEMRFYHEHTTYQEIYSDIWDELVYGSRDFESQYEREWVDKDEIYNTAAAAATTTAQVTPTTGESVPERTISLFPNAPWSTHHLGIFEFCLQICQTRVTNNQTMLAPSLLQAAIDGLDEVSSVQVQGIGFVCRPDGIKHRFNLTGDTEHLPVQIFDLTFPDEFPLENVNQAASQLIHGMNNMKSLKKEYFFCSERVNGITEGRDYPLYVVQPNRLRDVLEIFFRHSKAVKNALRCMELKCISKFKNEKVSMMKRTCILAQVMSFIQVRAAAYDEPLRVVSEWSEDLQEVLLSVWKSEMPSKESLKILRKAQMILLKASGVIPTVHYKDPRLNTPTMPSSPPFQSGDQQGPAEFAEEQSSSISGRTTVSGRETDDSPEIGLIMESTADYYAERPQN